jgi:SARP family transcriptional regulator, regulator of embCAB operon
LTVGQLEFTLSGRPDHPLTTDLRRFGIAATLRAAMEFQLLGAFESRQDGEAVLLGGRRQERLLLAILLLHAGQPVTIDRLADLLWDSEIPEAARAAIHTYVGRLRRNLAGHGVEIETRRGGYAVAAEDHVIDAQEFAVEVRGAGKVTDPAERARQFEVALARWRGPLLADLADDRLRDRLDGGLMELRLATTELLAEDRLAMGLDTLVMADLLPLVKEHPTRERLVGSLMTALYRCGRRSDALATYQLTREILVEDLGIEPGPALLRIYERILRDDSRLVRPPAPVYAVRVREHWMPWNAGGHPALEFCNTYAGWNSDDPQSGSEWLPTYAALAVWAGYVDLADQGTVTHLLAQAEYEPAVAQETLVQARRLRADLHRCLTHPEDRTAFEAVAAVARVAAGRAVFTLAEDGLGRWVFPRSTGLQLPVYAAATSAADLLGEARRLTVRSCPSEHCGWLFLDQTGMRKWCSMATCGKTVDQPVC